ncbi:hypothetical protein DL93DRAFT_2087228 [Clavulina sp. PMI_390]|nr:hypothetical protein DL93DRAFT_2087228 [Clavulina sp. PMI_390]
MAFNAGDSLLAQCRSIVEDELTALEAIYPDCVSQEIQEDGVLLKLELAIELDSPHRIVIDSPFHDDSPAFGSPRTADNTRPSELLIEHLPPLILDLFLPLNYPLQSPPAFLSLYASDSWLPEGLLELLVVFFHDLWREQRGLGEGVLWRITENIVHGEFLTEPLRLTSISSPSSSSSSSSSSRKSSVEPPILQLTHPVPSILRDQLIAYNTLLDDASFDQTRFSCQICLEDRRGAACIRLAACEHVFCKDCLRGAWGLAVHEGRVAEVRCPDQGCIKSAKLASSQALDLGEASESDVRRVLTEEQVARWKWLKLQRDLARDLTIVYCPLQFCQAPVRPTPRAHVESGLDDESDEPPTNLEDLRTCEACGFAFCASCQKAWHGPLILCDGSYGGDLNTPNLRRVKETRPEPSGSTAPANRWERQKQTREELERRRRLAIAAAVARIHGEVGDNIIMRCPGCTTPVEKSDGCNHMCCSRCGAHFCYTCGERLKATDPYSHWREVGICRGRESISLENGIASRGEKLKGRRRIPAVELTMEEMTGMADPQL